MGGNQFPLWDSSASPPISVSRNPVAEMILGQLSAGKRAQKQMKTSCCNLWNSSAHCRLTLFLSLLQWYFDNCMTYPFQVFTLLLWANVTYLRCYDTAYTVTLGTQKSSWHFILFWIKYPNFISVGKEPKIPVYIIYSFLLCMLLRQYWLLSQLVFNMEEESGRVISTQSFKTPRALISSFLRLLFPSKNVLQKIILNIINSSAVKTFLV